jgi:hypothetical protein
MAQPDHEVLAGAWAIIAEQAPRFANIPALNHGQTLIDLIGGLRTEIGELHTTLRNDITTLRNDITTLRDDITTLRVDVTTLRVDITTRLDAK